MSGASHKSTVIPPTVKGCCHSMQLGNDYIFIVCVPSGMVATQLPSSVLVLVMPARHVPHPPGLGVQNLHGHSA